MFGISDSVLLLLAFLSMPFAVLALHYSLRLALLWLASKPVVCVCRVENRLGVVLRKDHEKHSRKFWKSVAKMELNSGSKFAVPLRGIAIPVGPIYVFPPDSRALRTLLDKCRVEQSAFNVPEFFQDDVYALKDAHKYLFGREWDEEYSPA